jgi:hypothetical protein
MVVAQRILPRMWQLLWPVAVAVSVACGEAKPCVYSAQLYRADPGCLEPYAPLGLVEAEELASTCTPTCLQVDGALYLSSVCAPYPLEARLVSVSDPACAAARAAMAAESTCAPPPLEDPATAP